MGLLSEYLINFENVTKFKLSVNASYSIISYNSYNTLTPIYQCRLFPDPFVLKASVFQTSDSNTFVNHKINSKGNGQY